MSTSHLVENPPLRVLVDTNILLDVILAREPWASQAKAMFVAHDAGRLQVCIPASALTDIYYITRKQAGRDRAKQAVEECVRRYHTLTVDRAVVAVALTFPGADFEDNVQIACAQAERLDYIVTRNPGDFLHSPVNVIEPSALASQLTSS